MVSSYNDAAAKALDHLQHELQNIRTDRANPALVEELTVTAYGTPTPLMQLAAINAPEPRLIVITPWDPGTMKDIERAISQSPLGITPVVDGKSIRLPFPPMTEERRHEMQKVVNEKSEETRVRIRSSREDQIKHLRLQEKNSQLSEDALDTATKKLQQAVDASLAEVAVLVEAKNKELSLI